MRKRFGVLCIILGICCLLLSLLFVFYNKFEDSRAESTSLNLLHDVYNQIQVNENSNAKPSSEMSTVKVGQYDCIGIISIPILEIELPVLTNWNYTKLKMAPCLYYGSYYKSDFVIAAHNYRSHFGRLSELKEKDIVLFTDVSGNVYYYEVILIETLPGNATKEMITSGFDLSLYTCTPGGENRVTVRCNRIN